MVEIDWSPTAENDLDEIIDYIAQDSPRDAKKFLEGIHVLIENLKSFPRIGSQIPESNDPNDRQLRFKKYRIIYCFSEEKVQILKIIHGARLLKF